MQESFYKFIVRIISIIHLVMIGVNCISVPLLLLNEPFWISVPLITLLFSPLIGGTYCMFNNLENHFRRKANMPEINDRTEAFVKEVLSIFRRKTKNGN